MLRIHFTSDDVARGRIVPAPAGLRPMMTWRGDELHIPAHRNQELHLNGRGVLLIPSYFTQPVTTFDPTFPPVVVYPVTRRPLGEQTVSEALGALIGSTRAAVLETIANHPTTTTDLAGRIGISAASASQHATVLRRASLVASHRDRNRMLHHPTALGLALLDTAFA